MRIFRLAWIATIVALCVPGVRAESPSVVFQAFGGFVLDVPTTLKIEQTGQPPLEIDAHWDNKTFKQPLYWAIRLRWQQPRHGFELQLMHHKMFLSNTTSEVEHFEVTHGFNIASAHYVWRRSPWHFRAGAGAVLPDSESIIRGVQGTTTAYRIRGPAFLGGAGYEHLFGDHFLLAAEVQLIAAWATVDVPGGQADVSSLGAHFLLGFGFGF